MTRICEKCDIVYPLEFIFEEFLFTYYKCEDCKFPIVTNIKKHELPNQSNISKERNFLRFLNTFIYN